MSRKKREKGLPFFGIPKMIPFVRPFAKQMIGVMLLQLGMSLTDVARPLLQRYALNRFVGGSTLSGMVPFVLVYIAVISAGALVFYGSIKRTMKLEMGIDRDLRNEAFKHLQELSFDYYNQNSVGYIHARVMSDTSRIGELFSWQLADTLYFLAYIVFALVSMFSINPRITGLICLIVPVVALFFSLFQGKLFDLHHQVREINSLITGNFNEGIVGAKTIKSLAVEERIDEDFMKETSNMKRKSVQSARVRGVFAVVTNLASSCALAIVLWKGGVIAAEEVGTFSMFMSYAQELMEPVRWLVETLALFVQGEVNIQRYTALVESEPSVKDSPAVKAMYGDSFKPKKEIWEPIRGDIEFRDVSFKYPDGDEYILEHFDLKIPFGTNVAIVGETGAGKSTLANLICRFYEPTEGKVLIDGKDARGRSQLWLHSALGYVLQSPHLFSGSIRDNLLYGRADATDEEIMEALKLVSADDVVARLDKGLDSDAGEGGDLLSTGEKQLICLARAIIADPKILVLDEATASVDTMTERRIQAAVDEVIKGRTSIVIAHRLSTVQNADIILVVSDGKIVERGSHRELLAKRGEYYRLWTRQYEDEATSAVWSTQQ